MDDYDTTTYVKKIGERSIRFTLIITGGLS